MNKGFVNIALTSASYKRPVQFATEAQEGLQQGELLKLTGPAIFLDKISGNGRKYIPESVHQQVAMLQPRIQQKALFGELDHPATDDINRMAYVQMQNVSHRIDAIWFDKDQQTYFITVTVLDTPNGRILKSIYDAGSPLFVSLRSLLDASKNRQNNGYIDAYMMALITIDFVSRPGFADAELHAVDTVSNESMLAVCESLDIFHTNKYSNMSKKQKRNKRYIPVLSMESFAGVATEPTKDFAANVTEFLADVLKNFPGDFTVDKFAEKYPDSMFNGMIVGLYEDTNELMIKDANTSTVALIELDSPNDGVFNVSDDAEISYYNTVQSQQSDTVQNANEMYPVIATEDYEPSEDFVQTANDVAEYLQENYPEVTEDNFDDISNALSEQFNVTAELTDDAIKITLGADGATISIEDGKVGSVTEFWSADAVGTEAEVGDKVRLIDANGEDIASGEITALGTYGECKDTIESEDADGAKIMSDAGVDDSADVIKIDNNWYFMEDGMTVEPIETAEPATESEVGETVNIIENGETIASGEVTEVSTVGEIRDELADDSALADVLETASDDTQAIQVDGAWYVITDDVTVEPVEDSEPANEFGGFKYKRPEEVQKGDRGFLGNGMMATVLAVSSRYNDVKKYDKNGKWRKESVRERGALYIAYKDVQGETGVAMYGNGFAVVRPEANESFAIGDTVEVNIDKPFTGVIDDVQQLGDIRDDLDSKFDEFSDDTTVYLIDGEWYVNDDLNIDETEQADVATEDIEDVIQQTDGNEPEPVKNDFNEQSNLDAGDDVQAVIVDDEDDDAKANKASATQQMYNIIDDDKVVIVDDDNDNDDEDQKPSDDDEDEDSKDADELTADTELAEEAQRIFNMPNSKYAGNYAIEHMPVAYKNIWGGLSAKAKAVVAKQAKNAQIANEAQNLKFWSSTNFVAVERACLLNKGKIEAAFESLKPVDARTKFLLRK